SRVIGTRHFVEVRYRGPIMSRRKSFFISNFTLIACLALAALNGCNSNSSSGKPVEKPIAVATPQPASETPAPAKLPPPTRAEVESAFKRVFGNELTIDAANSQWFIVGDFNGDGSEDLAITARPASGKLADVNSELSNWIVQDADK